MHHSSHAKHIYPVSLIMQINSTKHSIIQTYIWTYGWRRITKLIKEFRLPYSSTALLPVLTLNKIRLSLMYCQQKIYTKNWDSIFDVLHKPRRSVISKEPRLLESSIKPCRTSSKHKRRKPWKNLDCDQKLARHYWAIALYTPFDPFIIFTINSQTEFNLKISFPQQVNM